MTNFAVQRGVELQVGAGAGCQIQGRVAGLRAFPPTRRQLQVQVAHVLQDLDGRGQESRVGDAVLDGLVVELLEASRVLGCPGHDGDGVAEVGALGSVGENLDNWRDGRGEMGGERSGQRSGQRSGVKEG